MRRLACVERHTCEFCGVEFLFRWSEPDYDEEDYWGDPTPSIPATCTACMRTLQGRGVVGAGKLSRCYVATRTARVYGFVPMRRTGPRAAWVTW